MRAIKVASVLLIISLVILIVTAIKSEIKQRELYKRLCFDLPKDINPAVFGRYYWAAFHSLASEIPCYGCRWFAEKFMIYFHDMVNYKLGKPIYDKENFDYFNKSISLVNSGESFEKAFTLEK